MTEDEKKQFGIMQTDLHEIKGHVNTVDKKVDRVIELLEGNPHDKFDNGLTGSFHDVKSRLEKLENFKKKAIWLGIGAALPSGYGISAIFAKIIDQLKGH